MGFGGGLGNWGGGWGCGGSRKAAAAGRAPAAARGGRTAQAQIMVKPRSNPGQTPQLIVLLQASLRLPLAPKPSQTPDSTPVKPRSNPGQTSHLMVPSKAYLRLPLVSKPTTAGVSSAVTPKKLLIWLASFPSMLTVTNTSWPGVGMGGGLRGCGGEVWGFGGGGWGVGGGWVGGLGSLGGVGGVWGMDVGFACWRRWDAPSAAPRLWRTRSRARAPPAPAPPLTAQPPRDGAQRLERRRLGLEVGLLGDEQGLAVNAFWG